MHNSRFEVGLGGGGGEEMVGGAGFPPLLPTEKNRQSGWGGVANKGKKMVLRWKRERERMWGAV